MIEIKVPESSLKLPISGETITFRALTAGDEKILVALSEKIASQQDDDYWKVVVDVLVSSLKMFQNTITDGRDLKDILFEEYLFLMQGIRIFSIGDSVKVKYRGDCGHYNTINLRLSDIELQKGVDKKDVKIETNEGKGVLKLKHPTIGKVLTYISSEDTMYHMAIFLDSIVLENGSIYRFDEMSEEDVRAFLKSLPMSILKEIEDFMGNISRFVLKGDFKCIECGKENAVELRGIVDFF